MSNPSSGEATEQLLSSSNLDTPDQMSNNKKESDDSDEDNGTELSSSTPRTQLLPTLLQANTNANTQTDPSGAVQVDTDDATAADSVGLPFDTNSAIPSSSVASSTGQSYVALDMKSVPQDLRRILLSSHVYQIAKESDTEGGIYQTMFPPEVKERDLTRGEKFWTGAAVAASVYTAVAMPIFAYLLIPKDASGFVYVLEIAASGALAGIACIPYFLFNGKLGADDTMRTFRAPGSSGLKLLKFAGKGLEAGTWVFLPILQLNQSCASDTLGLSDTTAIAYGASSGILLSPFIRGGFHYSVGRLYQRLARHWRVFHNHFCGEETAMRAIALMQMQAANDYADNCDILEKFLQIFLINLSILSDEEINTLHSLLKTSFTDVSNGQTPQIRADLTDFYKYLFRLALTKQPSLMKDLAKLGLTLALVTLCFYGSGFYWLAAAKAVEKLLIDNQWIKYLLRYYCPAMWGAGLWAGTANDSISKLASDGINRYDTMAIMGSIASSAASMYLLSKDGVDFWEAVAMAGGLLGVSMGVAKPGMDWFISTIRAWRSGDAAPAREQTRSEKEQDINTFVTTVLSHIIDRNIQPGLAIDLTEVLLDTYRKVHAEQQATQQVTQWAGASAGSTTQPLLSSDAFLPDVNANSAFTSLSMSAASNSASGSSGNPSDKKPKPLVHASHHGARHISTGTHSASSSAAHFTGFGRGGHRGGHHGTGSATRGEMTSGVSGSKSHGTTAALAASSLSAALASTNANASVTPFAQLHSSHASSANTSGSARNADSDANASVFVPAAASQTGSQQHEQRYDYMSLALAANGVD
ncbi:MAG: hypothetical protein M1561_05675 [Gammaproteobacteria bacterium]|nr:hypothetical protein [Gammaproteobacteria bacterium]